MKKPKLGYVRDTDRTVIDICVVCGNEFNNPGESAEHPFFCQKECSAEYRKDKEHYKELYKKQYLERFDK